MSDFAFLEDYSTDRVVALQARRNHREEVLRECFAHDLKLAQDYAQAALDHERDLRRARFSTKAELADARVTLEAFLVAIMAAQREQGVEA